MRSNCLPNFLFVVFVFVLLNLTCFLFDFPLFVCIHLIWIIFISFVYTFFQPRLKRSHQTVSTHIGTSLRTRTFIRKSPTYEATANNNNNHKFRGIFRGRFSFSLYIIFSIRFFLILILLYYISLSLCVLFAFFLLI